MKTVTVTWHQRRSPQTWQCDGAMLRDSHLEIYTDDTKTIIPLAKVRMIQIVTKAMPEPESEPENWMTTEPIQHADEFAAPLEASRA